MERIAESGFNGELAVERQDEIGVIGDQFNRVLGRMRVLMQENIQKETAYKDAQLKALLLQINPHFIYNTLDMFAGKLTLDGEFETADCTDFAQMIRYNTMTSTELPLEKELEHVINYVNREVPVWRQRGAADSCPGGASADHYSPLFASAYCGEFL